MTDEDTRVKVDVQAVCFDCCMVLVVGLSLSTDMFRCCHGCSVHVSSCLISPAQHRFGQTPRELDCTPAHIFNTISKSCVLVDQLLSMVQVFLTIVDVFSRRRQKKSMTVVRRCWPRCCHSQRHLESCMERASLGAAALLASLVHAMGDDSLNRQGSFEDVPHEEACSSLSRRGQCLSMAARAAGQPAWMVSVHAWSASEVSESFCW